MEKKIIFLTTVFLLIIISSYSQTQLTDIKVRYVFPNVHFTEIKKNQNKSVIEIKTESGNKLFYFSDGKFFDKSAYSDKKNYSLIELDGEILLNQNDTLRLLTENSKDKVINLSKIINYRSEYGYDKNQWLALKNDTLVLISGADTSSFGFRLQKSTYNYSTYYNVSTFLTSKNSFLIESNGWVIFNGLIFPKSEIPDFDISEKYYSGDSLYIFNKKLSSLNIENKKLKISILNDTTKGSLEKITPTLFFQKDTYFELKNGGLIKANVYAVSEPVMTQTIKLGKFEITPVSRKGLARVMTLKNTENNKILEFLDVFLERKSSFFPVSEKPNNEYLRFTLLKDSLLRVENLKNNHNYIFDFSSKGSIRYFEELGEDSLLFHLIDVDLNYFSISKKEYVSIKNNSLPIEKNFYRYLYSPGDFVVGKDSLFFSDYNFSISKYAGLVKDTIDYKSPVYSNILGAENSSGNNSFFNSGPGNDFATSEEFWNWQKDPNQEKNRLEFTSQDGKKSISFLTEDPYQDFLGMYQNKYLFHGYDDKWHKYYIYSPENEEYSIVSIDLESTFFYRKIIQNNAYIFDSQNHRIIKYDLNSQKLFEMKGVQKEVYMGAGLKAKKNNKLYYIGFQNSGLEIINVSSLDDNAIISGIRKDYFSQNKVSYFLGEKEKLMQVFMSDDILDNLDPFEWEEVKGAVEKISETRSPMVYPNPYELNLNIFSPQKILSFRLISAEGKVLLQTEPGKGHESNYEVERKINEFLRSQIGSPIIILQLLTSKGTEYFRILK